MCHKVGNYSHHNVDTIGHLKYGHAAPAENCQMYDWISEFINHSLPVAELHENHGANNDTDRLGYQDA